MKQSSNSSTEIKSGELVTPHKQVFLCYCHRDLHYAQRLLVHLAGCQQNSGLTIWDDSRIRAGSLWKSEVASALAMAQFAVLLISADFLASSFITTFELPCLLNAAQSGGTRILPVILHPCLFEESRLATFQAVNNPTRPLSQLPSSAREQIWVSVVRTLIHTPFPPETIREPLLSLSSTCRRTVVGD
jgi:TIR domain